MTIPAIVLAAGGSVRLGQPKQLLQLPGSDEMLLARAIRLAREAGAAPVFVVLGAHAEQIRNAMDLSQSTVLINDGWTEGMASSLRLGIAAATALSPEVSGVLIMVCDQPAVLADHLQRLLKSQQADKETMVASHYAGRCGVPTVVPRAMFPALLALTGDHGARSLFGNAGVNVQPIELMNGEWDIDTIADIRQNESMEK